MYLLCTILLAIYPFTDGSTIPLLLLVVVAVTFKPVYIL